MARPLYSAITSLDGYVADEEGQDAHRPAAGRAHSADKGPPAARTAGRRSLLLLRCISGTHTRPSVGLVRDRRLERARDGKRIAGVCAGLSAYTGIDVTLIRVAFVIFAVTGIGELVYLLLWIFAPKTS